MHVHPKTLYIIFMYQGHRVKVKVKEAKALLSLASTARNGSKVGCPQPNCYSASTEWGTWNPC